MVKFYLTKNPTETKILGKKLASFFLKKRQSRIAAWVFGLTGEMGSGKTTFLQGFVKGLGIKEKILSPTFIIMRKFKIKQKKHKFSFFYHIDCYRIEKPKELLVLGFKKIIANCQNIIAIEWPEKIKKFLPKKTFWIKFKIIDKTTRKIGLIKKDG